MVSGNNSWNRASRTNHRDGDGPHAWDFLTNHSYVLLCVAGDPGIRLRDIAKDVGITERAAHQIVSQLVEADYVLRKREGRRNHYTVKLDQPMRHPLEKNQTIGQLLKVLKPSRQKTAK